MASSSEKPELLIMGIDPGTNVLGYSILRSVGAKLSIEAMGVIDLRKCPDIYLKLGRIHDNVLSLIDRFHPDEMAIESPFFSKNFQTAIKLGRAQGVCIAAAIERDLVVHEYAPTKIKLSITGNGSASKEQVAGMLQKIFKINPDNMLPFLDATDALAIAYCHHTQRRTIVSAKEYSTWSAFAKNNQGRIFKPQTTATAKVAPTAKPSQQQAVSSTKVKTSSAKNKTPLLFKTALSKATSSSTRLPLPKAASSNSSENSSMTEPDSRKNATKQ